jgi:chromosome segregation ATPase
MLCRQDYSDLSIEKEKVVAERDGLMLKIDTLQSEYQEKIETIQKNFVDEREVISKRQAAKVESMESVIKENEANSAKKMTEMTEARQRIEERNKALQAELTELMRKYKAVSAAHVDTKGDLSKAQQTIAKNAEQFKQLATDLVNIGVINDTLRADLVTMKENWDVDMEKAANVQQMLQDKLAEAEEQVADMQSKVHTVREEMTEIQAEIEREQVRQNSNELFAQAEYLVGAGNSTVQYSTVQT